MSVKAEDSGKQWHVRQTGSQYIIQAGGIFYETEILINGADGTPNLLPFWHGILAPAVKQKRAGRQDIHAV